MVFVAVGGIVMFNAGDLQFIVDGLKLGLYFVSRFTVFNIPVMSWVLFAGYLYLFYRLFSKFLADNFNFRSRDDEQ